MTKPICIILTGPPGAGKSTCYKEFHHELPLVDIDLYHGTKQEKLAERKVQLQHRLKQKTPFVYCTSAPTREHKEFWLRVIKKTHTPILVAFTPPLMLAYMRHKLRPKHNDLRDAIVKWYRLYTTHRRELRISGTDIRACYARIVDGFPAHNTPSRGQEDYHPEKPTLLKKGRSAVISDRLRAGRWGSKAGTVGE